MQTIHIAETGAARPRIAGRLREDAPNECRLALAIASAAFAVAPEEIGASERRSAPVAQARHVAIYLAHIVFQLSMETVARAFRRDRTSIGHAVRRVEDRRDEPAFDREMDRLERLADFCRSAKAGIGAGVRA